MLKVFLFAVGVYLVGAITDPTHLCDELMTLNCKVNYIPGEKDETVCATNGQSYPNFCYYGQARCNDKTIALLHVGNCTGMTMATSTSMPVNVGSSSMASTMAAGGSTVITSPAPTTTGAPTPDPILEAFCSNKNAIVCGTELSPICGSDKQFYLNKCEYSKAYCDDKTLLSKPIDFCTGAGK